MLRSIDHLCTGKETNKLTDFVLNDINIVGPARGLVAVKAGQELSMLLPVVDAEMNLRFKGVLAVATCHSVQLAGMLVAAPPIAGWLSCVCLCLLKDEFYVTSLELDSISA
ncbi:hypothetical protein PanWU01x14_128140 [Parasponia andersonii]|uniref:Uncharacterized protein n=1 Tax=Parasponia andersonii TaxID=3476 RepID=A0A2P5CS27_PARAD|nr:hypothetical protein PanWU01x14_128140 [Parasponia andersonii]